MADDLEMPTTKASSINSKKYQVSITDAGVSGQILSEENETYQQNFVIPDALSYIQNKTELTRDTILQIIKLSGRINELLINPQMFLDNAVSVINKELHALVVDGIEYTKIENKIYEMELFNDENFEIYFDDKKTFVVEDSAKTIYDNFIPLDSETVEMPFAKDCEKSDKVEFYFKLPNWFKINTPIGNYNPDWAVVLKGEKKIYFIAETKGAGQELRPSELMKIKFGKAHFAQFEDVIFDRKNSLSEVLKSV